MTETITPTLTSIRDWFNTQYRDKREKSMRSAEAYPIFLDLLNAVAGKKLLDIGCGPGLLLQAAEARGLQCSGVDLAPEALKVCRTTAPNSTVKIGSVDHLDFPDGSFDFLTTIGVLEHFLNMDKAIAEMKRVAKPEALFCIMVPNSATIHWKMTDRFSVQNRDSNENAATLKEWLHFFESYDFEIQAIHRDDWQIRKPLLLISSKLERLASPLFKKILWSVLPLSTAHQFIFILKIKS